MSGFLLVIVVVFLGGLTVGSILGERLAKAQAAVNRRSRWRVGPKPPYTNGVDLARATKAEVAAWAEMHADLTLDPNELTADDMLIEIGRAIERDALDLRPSGPEAYKPKVVCLCGSTRFIDTMAIIAWEHEKQGFIAMGCHLLPASYGAADHHQAEAEGLAEPMDELHLRKIDLCDVVYVVNVGGYIGESTAREIAYARSLGKEIVFYQQPATSN